MAKYRIEKVEGEEGDYYAIKECNMWGSWSHVKTASTLEEADDIVKKHSKKTPIKRTVIKEYEF